MATENRKGAELMHAAGEDGARREGAVRLTCAVLPVSLPVQTSLALTHGASEILHRPFTVAKRVRK